MKSTRSVPLPRGTEHLSRRALLRASGAAAVLAPFVPLFSQPAQGQPKAAPRRVLFFFTPNGLEQGQWVPSGTETNFTFKKILEPVTPYQSKILFLHGVHLRSWEAQVPRPPNDHPPVLGHVLTANDVIDPMDGSKSGNSQTWFAAHPSIDQVIASRVGSETKFPSLVVGVKSGGHLSRLSYRGSKDPIPPESNPKALFDRLFTGLPTDMAGADRLRAERKSVIDGVAGQLTRLQTRVAKEDKQKIDAHLDRLRALETRLGSTSVGVCAPPDLAKVTDPNEFVRQGQEQMENIVAALACGLTRVAHLLWSVASTNLSYPWAGEMTGHHTLAHEIPRDPIKVRLGLIGNWYATQYAYLLKRLSEYREGDRTLLDNTAVVWYSEHAATTGGHPRNNIPFCIAGSCGGYFKTGRFLDFNQSGGAAHGDLFVSLAHAMGLTDMKTFGRADASKGPLPGLTV